MPDSVPNYLTTSPNGAVGAVFPGGIEMPATDAATPPAERRIRWTEDSGGVVAEIFGQEQGAGLDHWLVLGANQQDSPVAQSGVEIKSNRGYDGGPQSGRLIVKSSDTGFGEIRADFITTAGLQGPQAIILADTGFSSFMKTDTANVIRFRWTGASFEVFVDTTHVLTINVPGPLPHVI